MSVANAARSYGALNPAFTGALAGLLNGDIITLTYSTPATAVSPVGNYVVAPALGDPWNKLSDYAVAMNNGTLNVVPATLTVIAAQAD